MCWEGELVFKQVLGWETFVWVTSDGLNGLFDSGSTDWRKFDLWICSSNHAVNSTDKRNKNTPRSSSNQSLKLLVMHLPSEKSIFFFVFSVVSRKLRLNKMVNEKFTLLVKSFPCRSQNPDQMRNWKKLTSTCQIEPRVWKKNTGWFSLVKLNNAQVFKCTQDHFIFCCRTQSKYLTLITSLIHKIPKNPSRTSPPPRETSQFPINEKYDVQSVESPSDLLDVQKMK